MKLSHSKAVILMLAVTLMWSTAGVVTRHLDVARSFEATFWLSFFTVISLLVILPLWQQSRVWSDIRRGGPLLWLSGLCWCIMFTAFMVALTLTSVSNVLVTMALGPLLTALIARVFLSHRITTRTWAAIAVAGVGIVVMYADQMSSDQWLGSLVALCVPLAGATHWTVTQHAHAEGQDVDLVPAVLLGAVLSSLVVLPLALPFQATPHDLGLLAFLGLCQLAIPCVLSVICARVLKAPEIALLALLEVVFGIAAAWAGTGETPQISVLLGGSLIIGALVVNEWLGLLQRRTTP